VREVAEEPVPGQPGGGIEGTRLLEQVGGAGHDSQVILAAQLDLGPAVEILPPLPCKKTTTCRATSGTVR